LLARRHTYLTALRQVANPFPLVTSATTLEDLPQRLTALAWKHPVYVRGVHVVSGGALGVDGAAHRGALAGGGTTTVVLGSGIDVFYPRRHAPLFREVIARGGTVASLLAEGIEPRRSTFVQRNPLIAALADAVIVVEADVRSGSLSTAAAGKRFGRIVAAWPGSRGCERLLARGAAIVENVDDVDRIVAGAPRLPEPIEIADPIAKQIKAAMVGGACGLDQIVAVTGLSVRAVLRALPLLERMK
jgi:DNA processing protein